MVRDPARAGQFYQGTKVSLLREVESLIDRTAKKEDVKGVVSPHAGYMYSGPVAGSVLSSIKPKKTYVIIGPNHTGLGAEFGIDTNASWKTPLGEVTVNRALADEIRKNAPSIKADSLCHAGEHSVEVQIPFLQVLLKDFTIVPIVISYADLAAYRQIGSAIATSVKNLAVEADVTIIASSDMTHYESQESAKKKDSIAIEAVLKLDEKKLVDAVSEYDISMCGFAPTAIMVVAAKGLGATKARLVRYQTSGDASGDYTSVVGYAGIIIT